MTFHSYVFTEMPYPYLPGPEFLDNNRATIPNSLYDPDAGMELYRKYYDMYRAADELGLDCMVNEHHATSTCTDTITALSMAIIARETKRARILTLGNPVAHRPDPVRVAEEMAMVDVISGGRVEAGFVRGVPQESIAVNSSAVDMKERFWESIDLITKAWTTHDGPFNWEGRYFHHRQVNIWPRPLQQPHPPIWSPTLNPASAPELADRRFNVATLGGGTAAARAIFEAYRARAAEIGDPTPPLTRFAYSPFFYVGDTDEQAHREVAKALLWIREAARHPVHFSDPPGYLPPAARAKLLRSRLRPQVAAANHGLPSIRQQANTPIEKLIDEGYVFAGNPDTVFAQMTRFFDAVGGLGNFLFTVHSSTMSLDTTVKSMSLYAEHVMPRFVAEVYEPTVRGQREMVPDLVGSGRS